MRVLLPHEVIHAISQTASSAMFGSVLLGNLEDHERERFWSYIKTLPGWASHPVLEQGLDLTKLIPVTIHGDGAALKRDDEMFVWSFSSAFGYLGMVQDVLLFKYPIAIIPERHMVKANAFRPSRIEKQL